MTIKEQIEQEMTRLGYSAEDVKAMHPDLEDEELLETLIGAEPSNDDDGPMLTREAFQIALDALRSVGDNRALLAATMIETLLAQRGCEHFDSAISDGYLTTLCDVIVFG